MFDKDFKNKINDFLKVSNGISSNELKSLITDIEKHPTKSVEIDMKEFKKNMRKIVKEDNKFKCSIN